MSLLQNIHGREIALVETVSQSGVVILSLPYLGGGGGWHLVNFCQHIDIQPCLRESNDMLFQGPSARLGRESEHLLKTGKHYKYVYMFRIAIST